MGSFRNQNKISCIVLISGLLLNFKFESIGQTFERNILPHLFNESVTPTFPFIYPVVYDSNLLRELIDNNLCSNSDVDASLISFYPEDSLVNIYGSLHHLEFNVNGERRTSYGFYHKSEKTTDKKKLFVLLPEWDKSDYQKLASSKNVLFDSLLNYGDIIIPVPLNQDFRAIRDSRGKKLLNFLLTSDGLIRNKSLINCFMIESFAFVKYLSISHEEIIVAGRGNMGIVALIVGKKLEADFTIIEDGYTVWYDNIRNISSMDFVLSNWWKEYNSISNLIFFKNSFQSNLFLSFNCKNPTQPFEIDCSENTTGEVFKDHKNTKVNYLKSNGMISLGWEMQTWYLFLDYLR